MGDHFTELTVRSLFERAQRQTQEAQDREGDVPVLEWEDHVLALIVGRGRDWSVRRLAQEAGRHPSTLYRSPQVRSAIVGRRLAGRSIADRKEKEYVDGGRR